jgi:hypothetical protein
MIMSLKAIGELISLHEGRDMTHFISADDKGSSVSIDALNKDRAICLGLTQLIVGASNPLKSAIGVLTIAAGTQTWSENGVRYTFFHSNTGIHLRMQVENFDASTNFDSGCPFCGNHYSQGSERCDSCGCYTREHSETIGKPKREVREKAIADLQKPMTFMSCLGTLLGAAVLIFGAIGLVSLIWSWLTES